MKNKILSAAQMRACDQYTIQNERISSIELMERAALQFVRTIIPFVHGKPTIHVFCGSGNNGGDGFAVARLLIEKNCQVTTYFIRTGDKISNDCLINQQCVPDFITLESTADFPKIKPDDIVIDALLGTGTTRPTTGILRDLIDHLNASSAKILSIDIPSGLQSDELPYENGIIRANYTGTFERPKMAFFMKESAPFVGSWQTLSIGISPEYIEKQDGRYHFLSEDFFDAILKPRIQFSHKGTYGHGLIVAGSKGKMGAAVLASKAAMRSGIGLLTAFIPACGYTIFQTALPEAMCITDSTEDFHTEIAFDLSPYTSIGFGPGMGNHTGTASLLEQLFDTLSVPMVLDADALNALAENPSLLQKMPANTILTPHPKEFERLAGTSKNTYERLAQQIEFAQAHTCIVVLKDAITSVVFPNGTVFFNTTGNPGMATGGTGDALTGIITGLLSQGYTPENAALIAVYYHGKAGDNAAKHVGENQLIASDLIQFLRIG